jgi:ABC-2 type transport system permease protein
MIVLVRRELWEHRALWTTPLIVAAVLLATAIPFHFGRLTIGAHLEELANGDNRSSLFTLMLWLQTIPQYLVMSIVLAFYLQDCLYQERKDRSILFWKSLPVSDAATVISKLLVAVVVVPLFVYLTAMVTGLLSHGIWAAGAASKALPNIAIVWDTVAWFKVQALMLYGLIVAMAWFAPFAAFLLFVSAWARRAVFLWTTLPPVIAMIAEKVAFGTRYVTDLLEYRSWTGFWNAVFGPLNPQNAVHGRVVSLAELFDNTSMSRAFLNIDLWLGLAVAAALVFAAIRIRRYRDDT